MSQPENRVDRIFQEIESFTTEEVRALLMKMADRIELLGWLKVVAPPLNLKGWKRGEADNRPY